MDSLSNENMPIPVSSYREVLDQVNDIRGFIIKEYKSDGEQMIWSAVCLIDADQIREIICKDMGDLDHESR